jgi:lysozyme
MHLVTAPWTNYVNGWAPSHQFIKTLKLWYPLVTCKSYSSGEGYLIGHAHAVTSKSPLEVTPARAHELLIADLIAVKACMEQTIKVEISEGQFMAIMSWIFDLGTAEWTMGRFADYINEGDFKSCIHKMAKFRTKFGNTDIERAIRRTTEIEWWSLV